MRRMSERWGVCVSGRVEDGDCVRMLGRWVVYVRKSGRWGVCVRRSGRWGVICDG